MVSRSTGVLSSGARAVRAFSYSSPARSALVAFAAAIALFTALLMMPWATSTGVSPHLHDAVFTATSAVSVTGLTSVDTAAHWSTAGEVVILAAIQVGGLGIVTISSLLALSVTRQFGVRTRLLAQTGMSAGGLGEIGSLIKTIVVSSAVVELVIALILAPRLISQQGSLGDGIWHAVFYAVSAFNNAGFVLHPDGLAAVAHDPVVFWALICAVFLGSLGFPVLLVLWKHQWHLGKWNLHTRLTVEFSVLLMLAGALGFAALEWSNVATLGGSGVGQKVQDSLFASVMMRSGGFAVIEPSDTRSSTMFITDALMFVGGGSVSTAGGVKVTTLAVIFLAFLAEARGQEDTTAHGRALPTSSVRVAVSVAGMGLTMVSASALALMILTGEELERTLFESISAFATCGLSTGLSAELEPAGVYVLSGLMFAGRVGIITFATALTMRAQRTRYRLPTERPIIG
ncbi:TrkH family potassium uptake protein [Dietzia sp. PP-33]|jgi:trk system potassium uptake protein TrkH|uniref:TrkH family potassium uptake protein n=1 Tax=Dietzia sp. PP-33 TaxID=2957500 RepID=UPI0029A32B9B|nr:potassium transporter TrkG [Dietzia sp. PP-33]MDX2358349.1 TrkH family potassium uptake protein [Dietzia sp. PP-33]